METYYHATASELVAGQVLGPIVGLSNFQKRQQAAGLGWLEEAFEARRPSGCSSRLGALFATRKIEEAAKYILAEPGFRQGDLKPRYYRVTIECPTAGPMMLVGYAARFQKQNSTQNDIIDEYWHPSHEWRYLEYFGPTITVEEELTAPSIDRTVGVSLAAATDFSLARRLWPPVK